MKRRRKAVYFRKQHCTGALIFLIGLICLITGCSINNSILQYFGGIIGIISANSTGDEIKNACEYADMTATDLGRKMGITQPAISRRLKTGKFTHDELKMIATMIGCEYESKFEFENGVQI